MGTISTCQAAPVHGLATQACSLTSHYKSYGLLYKHEAYSSIYQFNKIKYFFPYETISSIVYFTNFTKVHFIYILSKPHLLSLIQPI